MLTSTHNILSTRQHQSGKLEAVIALLIILAFIGFAIPRLNLPFFWDATWVYAPAIFDLSRGIPSLLPDSIPVNIGRGHPLMFHFLGATWCKIFGFSTFSLNTFALSISVAVLVMVYRFGSRFFGPAAGLIALMICATQEMFVAQALQILPEMLLALFVLTTLYTYLRDRHILFVLSGSALLLTKETGVVVIGALGLIHLIKVIFIVEPPNRFKVFWTGALRIALPVLIASLHYIYQKVVYGWFFFPEHLDMQIWDLVPILHRLRDVFDLIFMWQGRVFITIPVLIGLCIWIGRRRIWPGVLLMAVLLSMHQIFYEGHDVPVWTRFSIPILCLVGVFAFLLIPYLKKDHKQGLAANALVIYLSLIMAFTATNLLTSRYVLNGLPVYALLCGWILSRYIKKKWMYIPVLVLPLAVFICQLTQPRLIRDINLTYADGVRMYQEIVRYFSEEVDKPTIALGTLLESVAMGDPRAGYVKEPISGVIVVIQRDTTKLIEGSVDYLINSNMLEYLDLPKKAPDCCELVKQIDIGHAHAEIYRIRKKPSE